MNLKEIAYIVKIADEGGITRAAEKLYLTPSALNQQLLHLEREIGTPLFHRSRRGWTPTEAGQIYLETAREMLRMERDTRLRLQDLADTKKGTLSVGFPPERGTSMFTHVYPLFHPRYPEVTVRAVEASVRRQQKLVAEGELDLGFVTLRDSQQTEDTYLSICSEELVLALPAGHPACRRAVTGTGPYPDLSLEEVRREPFARMHRESTIYECVDSLFRQAGFFPKVLFETARTCTILEMVAAGLCCSILPNWESLPRREGVSLFCLPQHPSWKLMALVRKGGYLTHPAQDFLSLAAAYWQSQQEAAENPPASASPDAVSTFPQSRTASSSATGWSC